MGENTKLSESATTSTRLRRSRVALINRRMDSMLRGTLRATETYPRKITLKAQIATSERQGRRVRNSMFQKTSNLNTSNLIILTNSRSRRQSTLLILRGCNCSNKLVIWSLEKTEIWSCHLGLKDKLKICRLPDLTHSEPVVLSTMAPPKRPIRANGSTFPWKSSCRRLHMKCPIQ